MDTLFTSNLGSDHDQIHTGRYTSSLSSTQSAKPDSAQSDIFLKSFLDFENQAQSQSGLDMDLNETINSDFLTFALPSSMFMDGDSLEHEALLVDRGAGSISSGTDFASSVALSPKNKSNDLSEEQQRRCPMNESCMATALMLLRSLHDPVPGCLSAPDSISVPLHVESRMADNVLSANKSFIQKMSDILKCRCSLDLQTQLVIATVCTKLMAWSRAILRCDDGVILGRVEHGSGELERVLHQPVTLGQYRLDMALESKVRAMVVLDELQQLESVIKNLCRRTLDTRSRPTTPALIDMFGGQKTTSVNRSESGSTHTRVQNALDSFLYSELETTRAEGDSALSNRSFLR